MRVACIQMRSGTRPADNIAALEELVSEAAGQGATYVQTPEMTGILERNPVALFDTIKPQDEDPVFKAASRLAAQHAIWLHLGSTAISVAPAKAANRGALFHPDGRIAAVYDKIHMFDVAIDAENKWQESKRYAPGSRAVICDVAGTELGMSICYDIRFPQLYRQMAKAGASILTCPAAFTVPTGKAHWEILLRARAIENGAFMIAAAQGGSHEDGRETWGHSMIVGPWGKTIGILDHDQPGILVCDIDPQESEKARAAIPNLANERKFALYRDETEGSGSRSGPVAQDRT
jgi:predicted amidohydrolase